ncbi:MAG: type III pantothenate kinase [Alphaproteobacteria bacterium]|nr:type III pantothenate kinase [Alphaproteobacteria bacterium]
MLLAIDCGNTNIVFAVFDGDTIRGQWRASSKAERTADEFGIWLTHLLATVGLDRTVITAAVIASVVPTAVFGLRTLCRRYFGCEARVVGDPDVRLGLHVYLDQPKEVGADRLVNAVAAHKFYGGALIVIDFGTATTFDVVDAAGDYRGGAIAPGIHQSLAALHIGAAQLPMVSVEQPERVIGTSTVSAMKSGIFWGYVGLIESLVKRIGIEFGGPLKVVATGGLASLFMEVTDIINHYDPDLTMRGLLEIHRRNVAS